MKSSLHPFLLIAALLFASLACSAVMNLFTEESPVPAIPLPTVAREVKPEPGNDTLACPVITDGILKAATHYDENLRDEKDEEPKEVYLVTYSVSGDRLSDPLYEKVPADLTPLQEDISGQKAIWDYYTSLIPVDERSSLAEYSVVTDGEGNILAAVSQTAYDPSLWALEVDIRDAGDKPNLTYTLIHEYAHLLTLGPKQVTPSLAVFNNPDDDNIYVQEMNACPDYFPGEGCSRHDSYINVFYSKYWTDIYAEWQDINLIKDNDAYYDALDKFYKKYQDRFLTDYASTNPEEDIAEAFTFYVLSPRPKDDTIADQKILFFYRYPELVQLREDILRRVCKLDP